MHRHSAQLNSVPVPFDEAERLAALHTTGLLDSEPDPNFDAITTEAAQLVDCPMALISLVDKDRHWFKSKFGLSEPATPRSSLVCAYTILSPIDKVLVVPDTRLDERFDAKPLVLGESFIRFYAGAPIKTPDGNRIGALCVLDRQPRFDFSEQQCEQIVALAWQVSEAIKDVIETNELQRLNPVDRKIGQKLQHAQLKAQLSRTAIAGLLRISVPDMESMERGSSRIEAAMLLKISTILNVPVRYFFEGL